MSLMIKIISMKQRQQPPFDPTERIGLPCGLQHVSQRTDPCWVSVLSCSLHCPVEYFSRALDDLILHPEYNSSIILRADILSDTPNPDPTHIPHQFNALRSIRHLTRRILPRRPERDASLDQDCYFYVGDHYEEATKHAKLAILEPRLGDDVVLPYYHPKVTAIAFRYESDDTESSGSGGSARLYVDVVPLPAADEEPLTSSSRLYRICLSLAENIRKISFGHYTGYQKRVIHDVVVNREEYQDLYLVMREKHKGLVDEWQEETDPLKHVFEDIGIATFIMLVWKHTYPPIQSSTAESPDGDSPWISWGRPPGGFIDLGCGNGLLVHILVSSGYTNGIGIDLRERKSWSHYPTSTQARLKIYPLDPTSSSSLDPTIFRFNSFIVGNHSDELTPWLPIIATLTSSSFLSIPCCPWTLDSKFTKPKGFHKRKDQTEAEQEFERKLEAAGGKTTLYATYLLWLFRQGLECGFEVETECLRIPSTRNWAFLCRRRLNPDHTKEQERYLTHVQSLVEQVKTRGIFKPRTPEGKAGRDH